MSIVVMADQHRTCAIHDEAKPTNFLVPSFNSFAHMQIDALCPRRNVSQQHEARIVGQLLTLLDGTVALHLQPPVAADGLGGQATAHILVVAATSRPNAVDPALRRPGR